MVEMPPLCHRCACQLAPGRGDFYVVRIEAMADPSPPTFAQDDFDHDTAAEIDRLADALRWISEREALDQVYRKLTLTLCSRCYRRWIEDPTGHVDRRSDTP